MTIFERLLARGDLRTTGKSHAVVALIDSQQKFDELFKLVYHPDRKIVMRAADAIEKITVSKPSFLTDHKREILDFFSSAQNIEFKWHLAQLVNRCDLSKEELAEVWEILTHWAKDKNESRIVRVNSLQSMYDFVQRNKRLLKDFLATVKQVEKENVPSLNARIRKFRISYS